LLVCFFVWAASRYCFPWQREESTGVGEELSLQVACMPCRSEKRWGAMDYFYFVCLFILPRPWSPGSGAMDFQCSAWSFRLLPSLCYALHHSYPSISLCFSHCATAMLIRSSHLAPVNCEAKIHFNWQFF
jgi:hypothetical protein